MGPAMLEVPVFSHFLQSICLELKPVWRPLAGPLRGSLITLVGLFWKAHRYGTSVYVHVSLRGRSSPDPSLALGVTPVSMGVGGKNRVGGAIASTWRWKREQGIAGNQNLLLILLHSGLHHLDSLWISLVVPG